MDMVLGGLSIPSSVPLVSGSFAIKFLDKCSFKRLRVLKAKFWPKEKKMAQLLSFTFLRCRNSQYCLEIIQALRIRFLLSAEYVLQDVSRAALDEEFLFQLVRDFSRQP